jgi:hypothetical protein
MASVPRRIGDLSVFFCFAKIGSETDLSFRFDLNSIDTGSKTWRAGTLSGSISIGKKDQKTICSDSPNWI